MDFEEFYRLTRHVEQRFFRVYRSRMREFFESYAVPGIDSPELILTPDCFERLCKDRQIFNQSSFEAFFEKNLSKGLCRSSSELLSSWDNIKAVLKHNLLFFDNANSLKQLLSKVDGLVSMSGPGSDSLKIWLNYKLLELEINRLHSESYVANLLPDEIIQAEDCVCQLDLF